MSMSALFSALRGAGRRQVSASTIGVRQATGSHALRIERYTQVMGTVPNGMEMKSGTFRVGGHDWYLSCYPNGYLDKDKGSISIFIEHASHARTGDATAKVELSILPDVTSKPVHNRTSSYNIFTKGNLNRGWKDFIKHDAIDKEKHLKDDCLTLLCDITVTEPSTEDHIKVLNYIPSET